MNWLSPVSLHTLAACILATALAACSSPPHVDFDSGRFDDVRMLPDIGRDAGSDTALDASVTRDVAVGDAPVTQVHFAAALCADPIDEAPILNGSGGHVCTRVGADRTAASGAWPDISGETGPFVYVSVNAMAGGDGSPARPFATISEALGAMTMRSTIVIGAGRYHLPTALIVNGAVSFVGAGAGGAPDDGPSGDGGVPGSDASSDASASDASGADAGVPIGTTLLANSSGPAIRVVGSSGNLTLRRIQIVGETADSGTGVSVEDGALVTVRDVDVRDLETGIDVRATSALRASRLSVGPVARDGIALRLGSSGDLSGFHVRQCGGTGILAHRSSVSLREGMLSENTGGGLLMVGASPSSADSIDRLVARRNRLVGVGAAALAGTSGIARHINFTLTSITGTTTGTGGLGGYGAFIGLGIEAEFDRLIMSDSRRGMGSEFLVNSVAGLLVSGTNATLLLHGALFGSNFGPGLLLQNGASGSRVGYSEFNDNQGVGVMVTSGASLAWFVCNESSENVQAPIVFTRRSAVFGDGLLVAPGGAMPPLLQLDGNHLNRNGRFGAFFAGATVRVGIGNEAIGNGAGPGGRDDATVASGMSAFIPANPNVPTGTDLPLATDTLPEITLL